MYRQFAYLNQHRAQLLEAIDSGQLELLTITPHNNPYYGLAKIVCRDHQNLAAELTKKQDKSYEDYVCLITALKTADMSFHTELSNCKKIYPGKNINEDVDLQKENVQSITYLPEPTESKKAIRYHYQKLLGKSTIDNYSKITEVPMYLLSTKWLEHFYSSSEKHPPPITNQTLVQLCDYLITQSRANHFNYKVREDVRQNDDFKIIPYEAWHYIHSIYGGLEVKRFTTKEKDPMVEVWYSTINILLVEERCYIHKLQIQVSKSDNFVEIGNRLRLVLKNYKIVDDSYDARRLHFYKSTDLSEEEIVSLIQDDEHPFVQTNKFEKIGNISIEFDETRISSHNFLIVNFPLAAENSIFAKVPLLKIIQVKDKCLKCGSTYDLVRCQCKAVYFCDKKCRNSHTQHLKECDTFVGQTRKLESLITVYDVRKRCLSTFNKYMEYGKVGLQNLGNTCYLNAALQCVMRIQRLCRYFMSNEHVGHLNVLNVLGSEGKLACAFGQLVKDFYTTNRKALEPGNTLQIIKKNPQFSGYNQQDSQQFLNFFLDKLHEDLNKVKVKPYLEEIESNGRPDEIVSELSWDNYKKRNNSHISDLFSGQYRSEIKCPDCQRISITFDPFMSVTLQFPKPEKSISLQGYFMADDGQFQKFTTTVKTSMNTGQFFELFFNDPVQAVYQQDKKITYTWNKEKSIFANARDKGILFVFQKPVGYDVEVSVELYMDGKKELTNFTRKFFLEEAKDLEEIKRNIYKIIRRPILKYMDQDLSQQEFIQFAEEKKLIRLLSVSDGGKEAKLPVKGPSQLIVKAELNVKDIETTSILKMNVSSTKFEGKTTNFIKKSGDALKISDLLSIFSDPETLTEQNAVYCSSCKKHQKADKKMSIYRMPEYLIVHLKRFNHRGDSGNRYIIYGEKVSTPINLEQFELINGGRYQLIGMVNHEGSLTMGHYTALIKRDDWFVYDDSRCYRSKLNGKNAYLLFYQRVQ